MEANYTQEITWAQDQRLPWPKIGGANIGLGSLNVRMGGELSNVSGRGDRQWCVAGLLLAGLLGFSSCASSFSSAFLSAPELGPERSTSLGQELQVHLWGAWYRVGYNRQVAHVQERALHLEQAGRPEVALKAINYGLSEWPSSAILLECRAALYGGMGYWRAAECDFETATRLMPEKACIWEALGRCRQELGQWNAARDARNEAQRLSLLP